MAYISQEDKARIKHLLKEVIPKDWKWSLGIRHHSELVLNIWAAPLDLPDEIFRKAKEMADRSGNWQWEEAALKGKQDHASVNLYWLQNQFIEGESLELFQKIKEALYNGNHDNSNAQIDYFDVGWYVSVNLGAWNKPFKVLEAKVSKGG